MQTLRAIVVSPEQQLSDLLGDRLAGLGPIVDVVRTLAHYPEEIELMRLVRAHAPQVAFLSVSSMRDARDVFILLERTAPGIQVVALSESMEPAVMLEVMRSGIREFLAAPFDADALRDVVKRITDNLAKRPVGISSSDLLYAFLPAKAGVGTTTLAVNAAIAVANTEKTRTLLADFDLNSGLVQFMMKLDNPHSVLEAAEHSHQLDEKLWPQLVSTCDSLDVLHAGRLDPQRRIEPLQIRNLLEFARRNYKVICADLSGNLERFSIEIMHEAKYIYVVCTPELPSLHLAREKVQFLEHLELGERIRVLLNRSHKRTLISSAEIEHLLGTPVHMTFTNDYAGVHKALTDGKPVRRDSELGKQVADFALSLMNRKQLKNESKRRFVQYFALAPARYSFGDE